MKNKGLLWILVLLFAVLMSIPWLVPGTGFLALIAFVPLLCADAIADQVKIKHFFLYYYVAFVLWNAATTFWVCNATIGGGIFAILCNALQMALIWLLFRLSKKGLGGVLPYIFLAVMWIAWERMYFRVDISWPWLVLGNAFASTTNLVQWYEYTGTLGGSLWVWIVNLAFFSLIELKMDWARYRWNCLAFLTYIFAFLLVTAGPVLCSELMWFNFSEKSEGSLDVVIAQPNFDPYQKFDSMSQNEQNAVLLGQFGEELKKREGEAVRPVLLLAPETFTSDIRLNDVKESPTVRSFLDFLGKYPYAQILFGASTYQFFETHSAPSILARKYGSVWAENHNSAILLKPDGDYDIFHKSKLVVGTELTPYPKVFVPLDDWLSEKMHVGGLMGRCIGQDEISLLDFNFRIPLGCAVCYESVFGEYCTGYVKKGAKALTVITNDAWWGDTPGYRQHLNYSRLRAIELRRDIARCGNTGISAFINQRGDIVSQSEWWTRQTLTGNVNLNSGKTFFVENGDIIGRVSTLAFLLLLLLAIVRGLIMKIRV